MSRTSAVRRFRIVVERDEAAPRFRRYRYSVEQESSFTPDTWSTLETGTRWLRGRAFNVALLRVHGRGHQIDRQEALIVIKESWGEKLESRKPALPAQLL